MTDHSHVSHISQIQIDQRIYDPRYNEAAAKLSWERTVAHFKKHLS